MYGFGMLSAHFLTDYDPNVHWHFIVTICTSQMEKKAINGLVLGE